MNNSLERLLLEEDRLFGGDRIGVHALKSLHEGCNIRKRQVRGEIVLKNGPDTQQQTPEEFAQQHFEFVSRLTLPHNLVFFALRSWGTLRNEFFDMLMKETALRTAARRKQR
jgi:hypothetical protein